MPHRSMLFVLLLVCSLGLFFQYNRSDGFLRLFSNKNQTVLNGQPFAQPPAAAGLARERSLLLYDPLNTESLLLAANVEHTLKSFKQDVLLQSSRAPLTASADQFSSIVLTTGSLETVRDLDALRALVRQGKTLYLLSAPLADSRLPELQEELGIAAAGGTIAAPGAKLLTNVLLGGKNFTLDGKYFDNSALQVSLRDDVALQMTALDGTPLLWTERCGEGNYVIYNGSTLGGKAQRGLLSGVLALGRTNFLYPVIAAKTMCIDDFPAPIPAGNHPKIYDDYHLSTPEFFRQVWWPDMLALAARYDVKYTGLIIETYNLQQQPPFTPEENGQAIRNNLILYGRELLKSGGELGVHGYNHQPLILEATPHYPEYTPWSSQEVMAESLREVRRYVREVYPDYQLKSYVPPSNMLSPQGRAALKEALPDLAVIGSIHAGAAESNVYYQDFTRAADGTLEMPRLSSDYRRHQDEDWAILNGISYLGLFSHFVHPDNLFYPENADYHWRDLYEGLDSLLKMIRTTYPWLRSATLSQSAEYFSDYLALDYRLAARADGIDIYAWNFRNDANFILRSTQQIRSASGCSYQRIDEQAYLITLQAPEAHIGF